ncbi:MAG: LysR family transcriptional regulator [Gammaproteobacteria bacterium]|nr:LysR family transcriptional regulator [Gammaproteobacteria bacterium]
MRYTIKHIRYFLAAAETLSVTRAADKMHVSQPSVSTAITHLEDNFGLQLFVRHHAQGLSLTPAGRRFKIEARRFISHATQLEHFANELAENIAGVLDVGCFGTVVAITMPALMRSFYELHPAVKINCLEGDQATLLTSLRDGRFDLALTYDLNLGKDVFFTPLVTLPPYILVAENSELASCKKLSLRELSELPMVMLDIPVSREYFNALYLSLGVEPNIAHRAGSLDMVRSLVSNGFGYSLSNAHMTPSLTANSANTQVTSLDGSSCITIPIEEELMPLRFGLVKLDMVRLTTVGDAFSEFCVDYFQNQQR